MAKGSQCYLNRFSKTRKMAKMRELDEECGRCPESSGWLSVCCVEGKINQWLTQGCWVIPVITRKEMSDWPLRNIANSFFITNPWSMGSVESCKCYHIKGFLSTFLFAFFFILDRCKISFDRLFPSIIIISLPCPTFHLSFSIAFNFSFFPVCSFIVLLLLLL